MNIYTDLNELKALEELRLICSKHSFPYIKCETLGIIEHDGFGYPIYSFVIGPDNKELPTFGLFGGVHGIEKIGTQVSITYLLSLLNQLEWDQDLMKRFDSCRLISIPLINPVGMSLFRRGNGNRVDLMRNAPIVADGFTDWPFSGQRLTKYIPWYRGRKTDPMQKEAQILFDFVKREGFGSRAFISLDVHSGFGLQDRLWFPYSFSEDVAFPHSHEVYQIKALFEKSFPFHPYVIEPQAFNYLINGDLWDFFHLEYCRTNHQDRFFIPWTLELGSWSWVMRNPKQFFSFTGMFNPMSMYRYNKVMRRHQFMIDFMFRVARNFESWVR